MMRTVLEATSHHPRNPTFKLRTLGPQTVAPDALESLQLAPTPYNSRSYYIIVRHT